ncbi:MAG: enoyl-CoA hydratase [Coxiellaceae bacterium]|nr:enoyl-CoA hydratase [Coxiellaceae bacterium]
MSLLLIDIIEGVATLTLNDPKRRNILSGELVEEMMATIAELESNNSVHAIVVTGAESAFCAGADLQDLSDARDGDGTAIKKIYQGFMTVARCKLPTIAAVNGPAVGAGMNLATACDVRIAAKSAKFDTRFLQLGLHPGGGCTWMLQRAFGWQQSVASLLFGKRLDGDAAVQAGLALSCVEDDELLAEAQKLAGRAARYPRDLLIKTKQSLIDTSIMASHQDAVDYEYDVQMWSLQQPAFADLIETMQQKIKSKGD